jgi:hypothetical protein
MNWDVTFGEIVADCVPEVLELKLPVPAKTAEKL